MAGFEPATRCLQNRNKQIRVFLNLKSNKQGLRDLLFTMKPPKETFCLEFMIDDFLQSRRALSLTPKTIRYYQQCLYPFKAYVGERELSDSLIRDYLISIKDKISNASLVTKASGIRAFLHYMEEETGQRIKLRMPKAEVHRKPGLSPAEIKRLFAAAKETWNYNRNQAILYTLLDTGLRAMELLSLQVDSINRQTGAFYIKGKGGKTRVGFLSAPTLSMIKRYVRQMQLTSGPLWVNVNRH
jgi:site-specific recombinase XerD